MSKSASKIQVFQACRQSLLTAIQLLEDEMNLLKESASNDKEGGMSDRLESNDEEMMNDRKDRESHRNRLYQELSLLDSLSNGEEFTKVEPGAIVITEERNFLIAIARTFKTNGLDFIGISAAAPIYAAIAAKKAGDSYKFNEQETRIKEVY